MRRNRSAIGGVIAATIWLIGAGSALAQATITAGDARRAAERTDAVRQARADHGRLTPRVRPTGDAWEVAYVDRRTVVVAVEVDSRGRVVEVWTGVQAAHPRARGHDSPFVRQVEIASLALCVLFLAPFARGRPRLLHLDLVAMAALVASLLFLDRAAVTASVWSIYPPLLYLAARFLWIGFRGGDRGTEGWAWSPRVLLAGTALLLAARAVFNAVLGQVSDVGYAGVFGANSIHHGYPLYTEGPVHGPQAYGPVAFALYLPFELIWPLGPGFGRDSLHAAHAAAIVFDLLVVAGLLVLGRRLRPGAAGTRLGAVLAWCWAASPLTFFPLATSTNDALVPLFAVWALVLAASPWARAAILMLGAVAKVSPAALLPLFARGPGERTRDIVVFITAAAITAAVAILPYVPVSDLDVLYDATIGYAAERTSPFTVWGLYPSLAAGADVLRALTIALGLAFFFVPRRRDVIRMAALASALLILTQLGGRYWAQPYAAWFVATGLVAVVAGARVPARVP